MTIRPPDTVADVGRWLTDWGNMIAQNSAFAGQLLAQLADSLPAGVEPDYSANFPAGYNEPMTVAERSAADVDHNPYAARVVPDLTQLIDTGDGAGAGRPQPRTTVVTDRWPQCLAGHPDHPGYLCELRRGHPAETMHEAHDMLTGLANYWASEPTASAVVDFAMPPETATIPATEPPEGLYPLGPHCASNGPFGHVCVATAGHGGPCWAPTAGHGRSAWQFRADGRPYLVDPVTGLEL